MIGALSYLAPEIPAFVIAVAASSFWARPSRPVWLVACLGYVLLDGAVTLAGYHRIPGLHWNWLGKAFSIALAGAVILILRPGRNELPLGFPTDKVGRRWTMSGILAACLFSGTVNFMIPDHVFPNAETIAYEATMPGVAEELCWRGLVFVLLGRAFSRSGRAPNLVPAAICATLLFGLGHGFSVDNGSFRFAWLPFVYATIFGAGMAVLRLRAKSLAGLVVTHNLANVCGELAGGLS